MIGFANLWSKHPTVQGNSRPCQTNGKSNFDDQCAIRLGACLAANGVDTLKLVSGKRHCWQHDHSAGHVLAAEELAKGLAQFPIPGVQKMEEIPPDEYQNKLLGKKGIIFLKDFWAREGELTRNRSGDHIDLWNGNRLPIGALGS